LQKEKEFIESEKVRLQKEIDDVKEAERIRLENESAAAVKAKIAE
jgi:hypothetical protein